MKSILVLHTGGTISMSESADGTVEKNAHNPLMNNQMPTNIQVTARELMNLPSPHMTPETMLTLQQTILANYDDYDGFVVTHGTDTLEETAYFLDLTVSDSKPVVVTGSMRPSNSIGADGLHNLQSAIQVAASSAAAHRGVLVVLNDEIHAARFVTKGHTTNVETFESPNAGPMGGLSGQRIYFNWLPRTIKRISIDSVVANTYLIKSYAGLDATFFKAINTPETNGLVIESTGAGNLPPTVLSALKDILDNHIPVAVVSRSPRGLAEPVYGYEGGGEQLAKMGTIIVPGLNGQKARIKLIVGLSATDTIDLQEFLTNNF